MAAGKGPQTSNGATSWCGQPIEAIHRGLQLFELEHQGPVQPSGMHRVMYKHPIRESANEPPRPFKAAPKWDCEHVRLPCAQESKYPRENADGSTEIDSRWEMIERALLRPISTSKQLQAAILSYNTTYKGQWNFRALHRLFDDELDESETRVFFEDLLPRIVRLALRLPELVQAPLPLLKQQQTSALTLSQQQISCLLANAFLCTYPRRNTLKRKSEYSNFPDINFNRLFQSTEPAVLEKLKCIFHYFRRVCPTERDASNVPTGCVTFVRRSAKPEHQVNWSQSLAPLGHVPLHIDASGTIEDQGVGLLQVDFANKYLGGGVLSYGCVQEEIRFVICPELLVGKLFTECMGPSEAVIMLGAERYSNYTGYASTFAWAGNHDDQTPRDSSRRRQTAIVAIDALQFQDKSHQYREDLMERELNKAHIGFMHWMSTPAPGVATGNWGCGAFGGDPHLKALLQLMVCAQLGRPLAYYTFGNQELRDDLHGMWQVFRGQGTTVKQLWALLKSFKHEGKANLYKFLRKKIISAPFKENCAIHQLTDDSPEKEQEEQEPVEEEKEPPNDVVLDIEVEDDDDEEEATNALMKAASLEAHNAESNSSNSNSNSATNSATKTKTSSRQLTLLEMLDNHYEQGQQNNASKRPRPTSTQNTSKSNAAKSRKESLDNKEASSTSGQNPL